MKNKGVFFVIILILIMGIFTTVQVRNYIREQSAAPPVQTEAELAEISVSQEEQTEPAAVAAFEETAAEGPLVRALPGGGEPAQPDMEAVPAEDVIQERKNADSIQAAPAPEQEKSGEVKPPDESVYAGGPLSESRRIRAAETEETAGENYGPSILNSGNSAEAAGNSSESLSAKEHYIRLEENEKMIAEMRAAESSSSTDAMKRMAETEYRLWDVELNRIYQDIIAQMDEREAEILREEERQWIRERDQLAKKASEKFKGGTMESLEYTASLAATTKIRTYELLEEYGYLLS